MPIHSGREGIAFPCFLAVEELSQNVLLVGKCLAKNANLGLKPRILRKFRGEIEILSTRNLLSRKFAAACRKIATSCPAYFLTHDDATYTCATKLNLKQNQETKQF